MCREEITKEHFINSERNCFGVEEVAAFLGVTAQCMREDIRRDGGYSMLGFRCIFRGSKILIPREQFFNLMGW